MSRLFIWTSALFFLAIPLCFAQDNSSDRVQVKSPIATPMVVPPNASAEQLEVRGDELRAEKSYFDALDFYKAAIAKKPDSAKLYNKAGMAELQAEHVHESVRYFEKAEKLDPKLGAVHNNLGAARYEQKKYGGAIK
jgi:tetratricopeptide (TPR) repeat protein